MPDLETSNCKCEVKLVDNYFFLENYSTSGGAVLHNVFFYTNNSSWLLVTKKVFKLKIILISYQ